MEKEPKPCAECGGKMEAGFIFDRTGGAIIMQRWLKGMPESGWLQKEPVLSYSARGRECRMVETYRCTGCGCLKSYAIKETNPPTFMGL